MKVMLAEPKTKRVRPDGSPQEMLYHMQQVGGAAQLQPVVNFLFAPVAAWRSSQPAFPLQAPKLDYGINGIDHLKLQMGAGV